MKAFIIDRTYRVIDGKPKVFLFGRTDDGKSFVSSHDFLPFFFIKESDLSKAKDLVNFLKVEKTDMKNFDLERVVKVFVAEPRLVPDVRSILEKNGIVCFEADIRFTQRFLMENNILSTLNISGNPEKKNGFFTDLFLDNPKIEPCDADIPLKVLSIDLEASSPEKGMLYSVALYGKDYNRGDDFKKVFFISNKGIHSDTVRQKMIDLRAEVIPDERSLLSRLSETVKDFDPDIITGWNFIDFDMAFLKSKYDYYGISFTWGRADWPNKLRIERSFTRDSKADVPGRVVLDGIHLLKSSFISLDDYKLNTAAKVLLGKKKLISGADKVAEINRQYLEEPQQLVDYNLLDAKLVIEILDKKDLINLTVLRSKIVGLPMDRVRASIASLDSLYLRELHKRGFVAPSSSFSEKDRGITGGFVKESRPGIYDYVIVLDFKSLYPSIMRTFNIDPLDHRPGCCKKESSEELIKAPNGTCFVNREGILPLLLQRIWDWRDKAKKRGDKVASQAFKILMNSFFGVMASPNCRFFNMELANAITHFAQHFIKLTISFLEDKGYEVIYGDTDSVFVNIDANDYDSAESIGKDLENSINKFISEYIISNYNRTSFLEIEFEKVYRKFLMPRVRGGSEGSKKRYAGLLQVRRNDGKIEEAMDFTGLEFVRRDWTELAKEFQLNLLRKVFNDEDITGFIKGFVHDLKKGLYDGLLIYRKAIRKPLEDYVKTTPPHVKAARILVSKTGRPPPGIIEYLMTNNGPEPVGFTSAEINYEHYIEKQLKPIADSILGFFKTSFDDVISGSSQKTLSGF